MSRSIASICLSITLIANLALAQQTLQTVKTGVSQSTPDTAVTWVELSSKNGELRGQLPKLLKAEIAKARALGRTPFLEIGATWCGPCVELEASLRQKEMIDAFSGAYVIHLDANDWDVESELQPLGFLTKEVDCNTLPFLGAIDKNGKVVSQMRHDIDASTIKAFVHEHLWHLSLR